MEKKAEESHKEVARPIRHGFRDLMPWHWGAGKELRPGDPFESLQQTMNDLLETFRRDVGWTEKNGGDIGVVQSRMDVSETDTAYEVTVELPGMDESNVNVSVTDDALTIRGEKTTEESTEKKNYRYRECSYGSVERVVPLPDGIDSDKIAAKFKKGVLTITLPKTEEARREPRKIEVKS